MSDVKLPAGYEDWTSPGVAPLRVPYLRITAERIDVPHTEGEVVAVHWRMPPKPKPTLPDVKPGAVIRFTSKMGSVRRAIRGLTGWRVFENGTPVVYCGMDWTQPIAGAQDLIEDVSADGFLVELEGL